MTAFVKLNEASCAGESEIMENIEALIRDSFGAVDILQATLISFGAAMLMSRYSSVVVMSLAALVLDQFVTIAFSRRIWERKDVGAVANDLWDSILDLRADEVILRYVAYLVLISVIYALRSFFKRT